jgi:addiction module RelB/DinJ family antitoxin
MNTTSLHTKIDTTIKKQAQDTAGELGLTLTAVVNALLTQFVRTKRLSVGVDNRAEIPNDYLKKILEEAEEDSKAGGITFKNIKEARSYVNSLIEHDKRSTQ